MAKMGLTMVGTSTGWYWLMVNGEYMIANGGLMLG